GRVGDVQHDQPPHLASMVGGHTECHHGADVVTDHVHLFVSKLIDQRRDFHPLEWPRAPLPQIPTWPSRVIRLVPPREGCRLPLNIGFLPLPVDPSQMAMTRPLRSAGITPASSLLRSSPPLPGASVLSASRLEPLAPFPLASPIRFSRSIRKPGRASRRTPLEGAAGPTDWSRRKEA